MLKVLSAAEKQPDRFDHHTALPYVQVPQFIAELPKAGAAEVVRPTFEFLWPMKRHLTAEREEKARRRLA